MRNKYNQVLHSLCVFLLLSVTGIAFANSYSLDANPNYTFPGGNQPDAATMAGAIQTRLGKPVTLVGSLPNENTAYPPVLGDSNVAPFYVYGPSANGAIKNLNLNTTIVGGIISAQLRFAGTDTIGGVVLNRFVLRTFTAAQFNDVLVKVIGFSGTPSSYSAVWSFYQVSASRAIAGSLANLSARAQVLSGGNVEIAGFIINGSGTKQVVLRGLGPSLASLGLTGVLADPTLSLYNGSGALLYSNNNWRDTQQSAIQATGLQPTNNLESAIIMTLNPGSYSAVLSGVSNGTGLALAEVYQIQGAAQLANLSTRAHVGVGNNVLIAGVIAQATNTGPEVLIRAIGPSLTQYGIVGALQDPTLELHDGSGALIAANNNWQDTQAADIQATGVAPTDSRESAILTNLVPGNYSAIVRGVSSTQGVASVEIYKIH